MFADAITSRRRTPMNLDYLWTSVVCLLVLIYLIYALLKPEKF
jgi:K+-transporting ATPase KdpF subunit